MCRRTRVALNVEANGTNPKRFNKQLHRKWSNDYTFSKYNNICSSFYVWVINFLKFEFNYNLIGEFRSK
jgi:hypothetical protein